MGLSSFSNAQDGLLPMLVSSVVLIMTLLKTTACSILCLQGSDFNAGENIVVAPSSLSHRPEEIHIGCHRQAGLSVRRFRSLCEPIEHCCVCLCGFEDEQEVSELRCRHFFHKACLQEWFDNLSSISRLTCPLCRACCTA